MISIDDYQSPQLVWVECPVDGIICSSTRGDIDSFSEEGSAYDPILWKY